MSLSTTITSPTGAQIYPEHQASSEVSPHLLPAVASSTEIAEPQSVSSI